MIHLLIHHRPNKGFTLVELLIALCIISLMSVAAVAGMGTLGDYLRAREISAFFSDTVRAEELKVLRKDLKKATIHFTKHYLVIEEYAEDSAFPLQTGDLCGIDFDLKTKNSVTGTLTKKDGDGKTLEVSNIAADGSGKITFSPCQTFSVSQEAEWTYQFSLPDSSVSNRLRFVHFNLQRENLNNPFEITGQSGSRAELSAPYAKKVFFDASGGGTDSNGDLLTQLVLKIRDKSGSISEQSVTIR